MMLRKLLKILRRPLIDDNPVTIQILGICSALAVTTSVETALVMTIAVTTVLASSGGLISALRQHIPHSIRIIIQITIIASLVIVVDLVLKAFFFEVGKALSVFVGLIVTNCIVLGRAEGFAMQNKILPSVIDGIGNGIGYGFILIIVGTIREILGQGRLLGFQIFQTTSQGGSFEPFQFMLLPPSAFFIIAGIIWFIRTKKTTQVEDPRFKVVLGEKEQG